MHPYRVFVNYSRRDRSLAEKLVRQLKHIGLRPVWDKNLRPGERFSDAIKHGIAHAHVFLPILTRKAVRRPWVHQETGYAMGLEIPVLPLAVGQVPGQMIRELQAITVRKDLSDLDPKNIEEAVETLLGRERGESEATFCCAALPEERAQLLARYTREALDHGAVGPLRQAGALSSFNLPAESPAHDVWRRRDTPVKRSPILYKYLYQERTAFEAYARRHGCDLVIWPDVPLTAYSSEAAALRLSSLLEFLEDVSVPNVRVAVRRREAPGNLTIVGDWYSAETIVPRPGQGYFQTIFTWHAPSVLDAIHRFDRDFQMLLRTTGASGESSRGVAIDAVRKALGRFQRRPYSRRRTHREPRPRRR